MPTKKFIRSDETRKKMRESAISRGIKPPSNKGKKFTKEHKDKMSIAKKGKKASDETKEKMKITNKGKVTKESRKKMSENKKGDKHPNWQGGKSYEEYGNDWTDELRDSIRNRDNYICQECGIHQDELEGRFKKLDVHHIDYNKYNLNPDNLITLCRCCHVKTNFKRDYWEKYFRKQKYGNSSSL